MQSIFRKKDWRQSRPHLFLLSRFLGGGVAANLDRDSRWPDVLGEPLEVVIERLARERALIAAPAAEAMSCTHTVAHLRSLLKTLGQPVGGNKEALVSRLLAADPKGVAKIVVGLGVLVCAPAAEALARKFVEDGEREADETSARVWGLLQEKRFAEAARTLAAHNAQLVFPPGFNVDWSKPNIVRHVMNLTTIMEGRPHLLDDVPDSCLPPLRQAAAMMHLYGTGRASPYLPAGFTCGGHLGPEAAARMLLFHARNLETLADYRESGVVRSVKILVGRGDGTCDACVQFCDRVFPLKSVPELPYAKCTSTMGCRCCYVPVVN
jgi:hypothetical protein